MFEDYKKEVLNSYLEKKKYERLDPYLQNPTTRRLKKECIRIYNMNPKKEERMLRLFFDPNNRTEDLEESIKEFHVEKFRPLLSFIRQEKNIRDEEPVKILAWLIGFESYKEWKERKNYIEPVANGTQSTPNAKDPTAIELESLTNQNKDQTKQIEIVEPSFNSTAALVTTRWRDKSINWKTWTVTLCSFILAFVAFAYYKLDNNEQCMYWNGNEYKKISCNEKVEEIPVLALDKQKLASLKKITKPDTITYSSIGKVWWAKVNGKVEFYTSGGDHPVIQNKRLLPITKYMVDKYIRPKKI